LAARVATAVVVLHEGRVVAQGPPAAALTSDVIAAAYGREGRIEQMGDTIAVVVR
jgi:iron complex transport system ATP-binding protein